MTFSGKLILFGRYYSI